MIESWAASLGAGLLLALLAGCARHYAGSWLEPGAFFSLVWSFYVLVPLVFAPSYVVWPGGVMWIVTSAFAICCGSWLVGGDRRKKLAGVRHPGTISPVFRTGFPPLGRWLKPLLLFSVCCGLMYSFVAMEEMGLNPATLFSVEGLVAIARAFSVARYSDEYAAPPLFGQIWLIAVYAAPILGGILFALRRSRRDTWISMVSLLPAFVVFLLQTARTAVVTGLILWISGWFATRVLLERGRARIFTKKLLLAVGGLVVVMLGLFAVGQVMREGDAPEVSALTDVLISPTVRASALGHISVFSQWFHGPHSTSIHPAFGAYSLAGVFDQLGFHGRPPGLYEEFVEVEEGGETNLYTSFRGLIEDFTLPGSLLFSLLVGMLVGTAYDQTRTGDARYTPLLGAFYAFTASHGVSIFNYNSILLAFLILGIYVWTTTTSKGAARIYSSPRLGESKV